MTYSSAISSWHACDDNVIAVAANKAAVVVVPRSTQKHCLCRAAVLNLKRRSCSSTHHYIPFPSKNTRQTHVQKRRIKVLTFVMWWLPHGLLNVIIPGRKCCLATHVAVPHGDRHSRLRLIKLSRGRQVSLLDSARAECVECSL